MGTTGPKQEEFDLFLSHASPDKEWVLTLADRLEALGLRVFVDSRAISVGDNFVLRLSDGLERSRYMVLVLSNHTEGRPWVGQEWTAFVAGHGPLGRLLPIRIDAVALPAILKATQTWDATDRDAARVADELFTVVGDPSTLPAADARRLVLGRDLVFTLSHTHLVLGEVWKAIGYHEQVLIISREIDDRMGEGNARLCDVGRIPEGHWVLRTGTSQQL